VGVLERQIVDAKRGAGTSAREVDCVVLSVVEFVPHVDDALRSISDVERKDKVPVHLSASHTKHRDFHMFGA